MTNYPIAIETGDEAHAWGVVVPDLPGCFSAGDSLDEAIANAAEAIDLWMESVFEDGGDIPDPSSLERLHGDPEYAGWTWAVVSVDRSKYEGKARRINVTIPENLLIRIDAYAKAHRMSRSGFLAKAATDAMR
jgi:predicted RNase H-like HicB family nuclease